MFEQERRPVCVGVMCMLPCWSQACASSSSLWLVFTTGHDSKISSVILCLKSLNYVKDEIYLSYTSPLKAPVFLFSSFFLFFSACRMEAGSVIGHVVDDVVRHWGKIHWQGEYCSFDLVFFFFFSLCVCNRKGAHFNGLVCFSWPAMRCQNKKANFQSWWWCFQIKTFCFFTSGIKSAVEGREKTLVALT